MSAAYNSELQCGPPGTNAAGKPAALEPPRGTARAKEESGGGGVGGRGGAGGEAKREASAELGMTVRGSEPRKRSPRARRRPQCRAGRRKDVGAVTSPPRPHAQEPTRGLVAHLDGEPSLPPRAQEPMDLRHREHRQQSSAPVRAGTSASSKASAASRPQPAPARFSPASDDKSLHPGYDTTARAPLNGGPRLPPPAPAHRPTSASLARSWSTDLVWIWLTLLSVTPRTLPISASVRPS